MRREALLPLLAILSNLVHVTAFTSTAPAAKKKSGSSIQIFSHRGTSTYPMMQTRGIIFPSPFIRESNTLVFSAATSSDEEANASTEEGEKAGQEADASSTEEGEKSGLLKNIKTYFSPPDDGLTFRQRLAKMGLAAVLSYGWVSNMSYSVSISLAWYIFSKRTGLSPLAPGQWKGFLAVYAGFWVFNNIVRPIRLAIAVAVSPQFDKVVASIQNRLGVNKAAAVTITVFLANVVGTLSFMSAGIGLASVCAGVPIWATTAK